MELATKTIEPRSVFSIDSKKEQYVRILGVKLKYLVQVKFEFNDEIEVEAVGPREATEIASSQLAGEYVVYHNDSEEYLDFEDVYGYDAEEIALEADAGQGEAAHPQEASADNCGHCSTPFPTEGSNFCAGCGAKRP